MSGALMHPGFVRARRDAVLKEVLTEPGHYFIGVPGLDEFRNRYFGTGSVRALPGRRCVRIWHPELSHCGQDRTI